MCGIFGYIGNENINVKKGVDVIKHRGPDAEGFFSYRVNDNASFDNIVEYDEDVSRVYFGFRRLAIIDINSTANQPMSRKDLGLCIVFNGEIYNYIEIRQELESNGYSFSTNSDTEVIICAYHFWNDECLNKFNGMWAFSILDQINNKIFCARDRFGVKPFYYFQDESQIIFCSEIKQIFQLDIEKEINENVIRDYLEKSLVDHTNETFYKNVYSLLGGNKFTIDLNKIEKIKPIEWYKVSVNKNISGVKQNIQKFRNIFESSIKLRFRSDVPVGSCLSGGLDSSSIVSYSASLFKNNEINVFNAGFKEKKFDESYYANLVSNKFQNVKMNSCTLNSNNISNLLEDVIYHQDEPFTDFGILSQWEVMKSANKKRITVLLDGQGGDEILAGYRKYYAFYLKELIINFKWITFINELYFLIKNKQFNFFDLEGILRYSVGSNSKKALSDKTNNLKSTVKIGLTSANGILDKSLQDIKYFSFPPLLRYEDRNSMAFSIETRVPFMDYRLVEFCLSLPTNQKIKGGYTKYILRESMRDILPDEIRKRISKLGFSTPQSVWLNSNLELKEYFGNYFKNMKNPYLNNKYIHNDFLNYPNSKLTSTEFSKFLIFDQWYRMNFKY